MVGAGRRMAALTTLTSTVLTGLFLVVVAVVVLRLRSWEAYRPGVGEHRRPSEWLSSVAGSMRVWIATFLVAAVGTGVGAILFVSGSIPASAQNAAGVAVASLFVLLFLFYLFYGIYQSARSRGWKSAQAAAFGSWALGLLFLLTIALQLVLA